MGKKTHDCKVDNHKCNAGYELDDISCPVHTTWHKVVTASLQQEGWKAWWYALPNEE